jgi:hypothetical protein
MNAPALQVKHNLLLGASAHLNESTPEIREDPMHLVLAQATNESNGDRINSDKLASVFHLLDKNNT